MLNMWWCSAATRGRLYRARIHYDSCVLYYAAFRRSLFPLRQTNRGQFIGGTTGRLTASRRALGASEAQTQRASTKEKVAGVWTLTQEQGASRQGPADLDVVNVRVLVGNVLHGNLLCDLEMSERVSRDLSGKQQRQKSVCATAPSSQSKLCLCLRRRWPCLRTTGRQNSPWSETRHCNDPGTP